MFLPLPLHRLCSLLLFVLLSTPNAASLAHLYCNCNLWPCFLFPKESLCEHRVALDPPTCVPGCVILVYKKSFFSCDLHSICFLLFSVLKNYYLLRWPSTGEDVLTWHLLSKVLKKGVLSFFSVICWQAKSSLLVDPPCDSINPFYCFPPMENNSKSTSKSLTSEAFSLKLGAHLEKKKVGVELCHKPLSGKCPLSL